MHGGEGGPSGLNKYNSCHLTQLNINVEYLKFFFSLTPPLFINVCLISSYPAVLVPPPLWRRPGCIHPEEPLHQGPDVCTLQRCCVHRLHKMMEPDVCDPLLSSNTSTSDSHTTCSFQKYKPFWNFLGFLSKLCNAIISCYRSV